MAIERNEQGAVKLVISKVTWQQLCSMADVECSRRLITPNDEYSSAIELVRERVNVPTILARGYRSEPTFWVCAAMVLGNADAMMLAAISVPDGGYVTFPGLELF
jgi:hypothetical protein